MTRIKKGLYGRDSNSQHLASASTSDGEKMLRMKFTFKKSQVPLAVLLLRTSALVNPNMWTKPSEQKMMFLSMWELHTRKLRPTKEIFKQNLVRRSWTFSWLISQISRKKWMYIKVSNYIYANEKNTATQNWRFKSNNFNHLIRSMLEFNFPNNFKLKHVSRLESQSTPWNVFVSSTVSIYFTPL